MDTRCWSVLVLSVTLAVGTAAGGEAQTVFINEIHYDNSGTDAGEAIEIAGPAGTDLAGWSLVLYNGNGGAPYNTTALGGTIPNQQNGFGTIAVSYPTNGIQNGSPDGVVLFDGAAVVQFLSYEGTFTAAGGVADGLTSTDIGVSESSGTPVGHSLQLGGSGTIATDFTWSAAQPDTFGAPNVGQVFTSGGGPDLAPEVVSTVPGDGTGGASLDTDIEITFSEGVVALGGWFDISCSTSGAHTASVGGGPLTFTLDPDVDFSNDEACTVTVFAAQVTDVDTDDPPDAMAADFTFTFGTLVDSPIVINEVDADTPGSDALEFVELYDGGVGNTPLDGLAVVFFNGNGDSSYRAIDLDGFSTDGDGFFLLGNAAVDPAPPLVFPNNGLQNGADAVALFSGDAADFPNGTPVTGVGLVDALVYDTNDSDDAELLAVLTPGAAQVNEGGGGNSSADSNARVPDGGAAFDTSTYEQQGPTPGVSNVRTVEIYEIQGAGLASPYEDGYVRTRGNVVTALGTDGFFMQTPAARTDGDADTSDGVFVFTAGPPGVAVGDLVDVEGRIREFFGLTEFTSGTTVEIVGSGDLPPMVSLDAAVPSPDPTAPSCAIEFECYEGMLVEIVDGTVTGPNQRFGSDPIAEVYITAAPARTFREPGIEFPGLPGLPVWDGNPEVFELDPDKLGLPNRIIPAGSSFSAVGVIGYEFGGYELWPAELTVADATIPRGVRERAPGELTVGSLNLFRLFDDLDDPPSYDVFGRERDDQVVSSAEYGRRRAKLAVYILDVLDAPDILAVQEAEKLAVLEALAADIASMDAGVVYRAHLEEGNDPGTIDIGFLVRDTVRVKRMDQIDREETFFNPIDLRDDLLHDRPPLLLEAIYRGDVADDDSDSDSDGLKIAVIGVHNRSFSGIDGPEAARVRAKRLAQAQSIAGYVDALQGKKGNKRVMVIGDFNDFEFSDGYVDAIGQIAGYVDPTVSLLAGADLVEPDLVNLVDRLAPEERYSFIFRGSAQALEHALVSRKLDKFVRGAEFARGNADAAVDLLNDETTVLRASDHDGLVVFIQSDPDKYEDDDEDSDSDSDSD